MFSTSLAKMWFHFILDLAFLLYIDSICFKLSSSQGQDCLLNGCYRTLGYFSTTAQTHLVSVNVTTCLSERNVCFRNFMNASFTIFLSRITLLLTRSLQQYLQHRSFHLPRFQHISIHLAKILLPRIVKEVCEWFHRWITLLLLLSSLVVFLINLANLP